MAKTVLLYSSLAIVFVLTVGLSAYLGTRQAAPILPDSNSVATTSTPLPETKKQDELELVITSPLDGATLSASAVVVRGKTAALADVAVNDIDTAADASGNFQVRLNLDEGENTIFVVVSDDMGREVEKMLTVRVSL